MSAITIFVLIGVAHWAAHVMQCQSCRAALSVNAAFALEGVIYVFGWPFHFTDYLVDLFGKPRGTGLTAEEAERIAKERIDAFFNNAGAVRVTRNPDESDEAFNARIQKTVSETIAQKRAQMKEGNP